MTEPVLADQGGGAVVFFHAHPDDEAIFTGGTMVRLAEEGWRLVLVVATRGELGAPRAPGEAAGSVAEQRVDETRRAADLLGVARVEFLGYRDSGMLGDPANTAPGALWSAATDEVAGRLARLLGEERAAALVVYDQTGIYGHPDHVKVHEAGVAAAELASTPVLYEATVDREYLHFVETHVVIEAGGGGGRADVVPGELGLVASPIGMPTVEITTTVDVRGVLQVKRAAMAAHGSQIPETASAMRLPTDAFAAVYGFEWFIRQGPPGPIEAL
ncbi:MAG: PIG-L family deacetylase [Actinomycetota bacterium]|nr:PIG-L family deacetylase [Actinomycetota bacterium]